MSLKSQVVECFAVLFTKKTLSVRQKWILGLINLSAVVIFWVLSSFLVNDLFETDIYRKPFFITYLNTGCFAFYLIPYLWSEGLSLREFIDALQINYHESRIGGEFTNLNDMENYGSSDNLTTLQQDTELQIPLYETIKLSSQFAVLWFSANLVTNASLSYTSVASQTILSSSSSFFTLIIGYLCMVEKINLNKIIGLVLSFVGVIIVTKIDSSDPPNENTPPLLTLWGNLLALSGALFYGVYTILLKFKVMIKDSHKERVLNTHLFFAFVGIFTLVFLWPVIILLHFTGHEKFELPPNSYALILLSLNMLITFISDLCWCKAVLLTSPLTVTVGLSMTIPIAMVGDWLIKGFRINWLYLLGASIVTAGFLIINNDEEEDFVSHRDE
ncbi:thiamine-repressible mitochondrial transport protein Thi74p [[Candida] anglica]|uniref:Thiamine-repressible mitochondrial transport protein Thi74p n=1 Tax=[Candida] anglica TaxID=148631 RepID=A0ABP0ECP0_9ASCO